MPGLLTDPRRRRQILPMLLLVGLTMTGNGMVAPMLSVYAQQFGVGGAMVGMIITLFGVGRLIANIPAGIASERFGRRPLMILGPAIMCIGSVGAAVAGSYEMLVAWRFVQGLGSGIYMTTSGAAMIDLAGPGERGRMMAYYQGALLCGAGIGPAVGGFLAEHFGYASPFWAFAFATAAGALVAWLGVDESSGTVQREAEPEGGRASMRTLLRQRGFLFLCFVTFGSFFTRTAAMWNLIPMIGHDDYGLSLDVVGLALTLTVAVNFAVLPLAAGVIDRWGAKPVTVISTLVTAGGLFLVAFVPGVSVYWVSLVILGAAGGFNGPASAAATADEAPPGLYGPAMGALRAVGDTGFILGPIIVGLINDFTGYGHAGGMLFNAVLMMVAGVVFGIGSRRRTKAAGL